MANKREDSENSCLMENIELGKMAAEIDSKPEKYNKKEAHSGKNLVHKEIKISGKQQNPSVRYYPTNPKVPDRTIEGFRPKNQEYNPEKICPPPIGLSSELVLKVHNDLSLLSEFESRCIIEDDVVYRETTKPLKKKTLKKKVVNLCIALLLCTAANVQSHPLGGFGVGLGLGLGSYGGYGSYGGFGSYGGYESFGGYGSYGGVAAPYAVSSPAALSTTVTVPAVQTVQAIPTVPAVPAIPAFDPYFYTTSETINIPGYGAYGYGASSPGYGYLYPFSGPSAYASAIAAGASLNAGVGLGFK